MKVLGIDPGTEKSGWCIFDSANVHACGIDDNEELATWKIGHILGTTGFDESAIEMIQSFGSVIGRETLETCVWIGRFWQILDQKGIHVSLFVRQAIKSHITGMPAGNDSTVIRALKERFGGSKKGQPLESVTKDAWQALAVAVVRLDGATTYWNRVKA